MAFPLRATRENREKVALWKTDNKFGFSHSELGVAEKQPGRRDIYQILEDAKSCTKTVSLKNKHCNSMTSRI